MLEAVIDDGGKASVSEIARRTDVPVATAHRQVASLVTDGYLARSARGRHVAGPRLRHLLTRVDEKQIVAVCAAPWLHGLAAQVRSVVQLGTFENDMVTYRVKTGRGSGQLFTRVDMQLEAYCSGIGKVLLAHLPHDQLDAYLAAGRFVALTPNTITDSKTLRAELVRIARQGFAVDNGEVVEDLVCTAVPIRAPAGNVTAAISVSHLAGSKATPDRATTLDLLRQTASAIETSLIG